MIKLPVLLIAILITVSMNAEAYLLREAPRGDWVRWHESEVDILLDPSLKVVGPLPEVEQAIIEGFRIWTEQSVLPVSFRFKRVQCAADTDNRSNCILACATSESCEQFTRNKGATTQLRYSRRGQIFGASIVLNSRDWKWSLGHDDDRGLDLRFVIAHEAGHFLGIRHSKHPAAVMYPIMQQKDTRPLHLTRDDRAAVRALYGRKSDMKYGHVTGTRQRNGHHSLVERSLLILYMFLSLVSMVLYSRESVGKPAAA